MRSLLLKPAVFVGLLEDVLGCQSNKWPEKPCVHRLVSERPCLQYMTTEDCQRQCTETTSAFMHQPAFYATITARDLSGPRLHPSLLQSALIIIIIPKMIAGR